MIVFDNRTWQMDTSSPDTNYLEGIACEQPKWVLPDNSELAGKIMSTPYWEPIEDDEGQLVDIVPIEPPVSDEDKINVLKAQLADLDSQAIRPLRAIVAGNDTEEDREILADLDRQAVELREQIEILEERSQAIKT